MSLSVDILKKRVTEEAFNALTDTAGQTSSEVAQSILSQSEAQIKAFCNFYFTEYSENDPEITEAVYSYATGLCWAFRNINLGKDEFERAENIIKCRNTRYTKNTATERVETAGAYYRADPEI